MSGNIVICLFQPLNIARHYTDDSVTIVEKSFGLVMHQALSSMGKERTCWLTPQAPFGTQCRCRSAAAHRTMHVLATVATWATLASADWASTTVANRSAGEQLASQLEARLHPQNYSLESTHLEDIRSFFWWDGALQEEDEVRATIDSDVPFSVLLEGLSADHPYDLPMIVSSAHLDSQEDHSSHKHAMALALVNGTTMEVAHGLAKSIVEVKFAACAQAAKLKADSDSEFTITLKTLGATKEQIEIEFGGLDWEWHPIQANEKYLKWIEDNVVVRPHASEL